MQDATVQDATAQEAAVREAAVPVAGRRRLLALVVLLARPLAVGVWLLVAPDSPARSPDAGVYAGLVSNIREHGSWTSPTDQFWIRASPADVVRAEGRVEVPDFGPVYPAAAATLAGDPFDGFLRLNALAAFALLLLAGGTVLAATGRLVPAVLLQAVLAAGPNRDGDFGAQRLFDTAQNLVPDVLAMALFLGALLLLRAGGRTPPAASYVAAAVALVAAGLARYASIGLLLGPTLLLALPLVRHRPWPTEDRAATVAIGGALGALAGWFALMAAVGRPSAKALRWHGTDLGPIADTIAGWFGSPAALRGHCRCSCSPARSGCWRRARSPSGAARWACSPPARSRTVRRSSPRA